MSELLLDRRQRDLGREAAAEMALLQDINGRCHSPAEALELVEKEMAALRRLGPEARARAVRLAALGLWIADGFDPEGGP